MDQAGHLATNGETLPGHHNLADERLHVFFTESGIAGISELLPKSRSESSNGFAVDASPLVTTLAFEQIDLLIEGGASRLVARETLLEILVLGIDQSSLDRFEKALDGDFGSRALVAQRDDVALALGVGSGRSFEKLSE
ncbi:hypothetical protein [Qipengyuania sp. MTN3-11]|uniref:hypothetical protein n=1 Tax=Qipengyuania sp. MTN3-11 TaxID=3056557 RepID=UPI0036F248BD